MGRKKDICAKVKGSHNKYGTYSKAVLTQIKYLISQLAFADTQELFSQVMNSWESQVNTNTARYDAVCKSCVAAIEGVSVGDCKEVGRPR